jgi:hypothetical protein
VALFSQFDKQFSTTMDFRGFFNRLTQEKRRRKRRRRCSLVEAKNKKEKKI